MRAISQAGSGPGRALPRALVAADEANARGALSAQLGAVGYEVVTAASREEAIDVLSGFAPHLVVADVELPDGDRPLIAAVNEHGEPPAALILIARRDLVPAAIRGLAAGAHGYLTKPVEAEHLRLVAERLIDDHRLRARVGSMRARLNGHPALRRLIGESPSIQAVRAALAQAAESRAPVLVAGETGTGKLLAAQLLHECRDSSGPFVTARCATLLCAELERALEHAHAGTIYLDEVADLPPPAQQALAEFLARRRAGQDQAGGPRRRRSTVCLVGSTATDLAARADTRAFSAELLALLGGIQVAMPSLRQRRGDIPLLVDHFVRQRRGTADKGADGHAARIDDGTLTRLMSYRWPGNVYELKRFVAQSGIGLAR